jgi:hypothetical protein
MSTICTFGCKASVAIPKRQRTKLEGRSTTSIHLGLAIGKKAFLIYNPLTQKVLESRDVHFFEQVGKDSEHITFEVPEGDPVTHMVDREGSGDESASEVEVEMDDEGDGMQE